MGKTDNPWVAVLEDGPGYEETCCIEDYLEKQANLLSDATHGHVRAEYHPVESKYVRSFTSGLSQFGKTVSSFVDESKYEDAGMLYETKFYAFDIYGRNYRFRLFSLDCKPIFPVKLRIDEGVYKDASSRIEQITGGSWSDAVSIQSFKMLQEVFECILTSNKLKYLLRRLMKETDGS